MCSITSHPNFNTNFNSEILGQEGKQKEFEARCQMYIENLNGWDLEDFFVSMLEGEKGCFSKGHFLNPRLDGFKLPEDIQVELIKILLNKNCSEVSRNISCFEIENPKTLIEIAKLCGPQCLRNLVIDDQKGLVELVAHFLKEFPESEVIDELKFIGDKNPEDMLQILKMCSVNQAHFILANLDDFGFEPKHIIEIANKVADRRPNLILLKLYELGIEDNEALQKLKEKCILLGGIPCVDRIRELSQSYLSNIYGGPLSKTFLKDIPVTNAESSFDEVLDYIKTIAANRIEMLGRKMWIDSIYGSNMKEIWVNLLSENNLKKGANMSQADRLMYSDILDEMQCEETSQILLRTFFGIDNLSSKTHQLQYDLKQLKEGGFAQFKSVIEENSTKFDGKPTSHFFSYQLNCYDLGHTLTLVQYRDKDHGIRYRVLQSWINDHTLRDYLLNRDISYSQEEFESFMDGFEHCLTGDTWTLEMAEFYIKYFLKENSSPIGKPLKKEDVNFSCLYGASDGSQLAKIKAQFEEFRPSVGP